MGYNILVVDDSDIIRSVIKKSLEMSGLEVGEIHEAAHGKAALEVLHETWVDIVFSDINMPEMNGIELVAAMKEDDVLNETPVVIISTERSQARIDKLTELGVGAYIKKPFRPEDLRDAVTKVLNSKKEETEA